MRLMTHVSGLMSQDSGVRSRAVQSGPGPYSQVQYGLVMYGLVMYGLVDAMCGLVDAMCGLVDARVHWVMPGCTGSCQVPVIV